MSPSLRATSQVIGRPASRCAPITTGSTRAPRLSTFETATCSHAALAERIERARAADRLERGRRAPARRATAAAVVAGRAHPPRSSRSETNWREPERLARRRLGDVRPDRVVGREARHQRDRDLRRRARRRARPSRASFTSRKLRPSTASTAPLTTPPKRVAMPPARTTCATSPGRERVDARRARLVVPGVAGLRERRDVVVARAARPRPRTTFDAGDSSPDATRARSVSKRSGRTRSARARRAVPRSTSSRIIGRRPARGAACRRTGRGGRRPR